MYKVLYPRDDKERQHVSRKEGGRGLAWMHQYEDSKTTLKRSKKNRLQLPETVLTK